MKNSGALKLTAQSDREIVMTRVFAAPPILVLDAYTRPELLKRWLGVFGGWSMPVCEVDLRAGANIAGCGGTPMVRYESTEARDAVIQSPMESGVAQSYDKLAELSAAGEIPRRERT